MATTALAASAPITDLSNDMDIPQESVPDKISAYYSLVFPNFTYYIQTLKVIIGRRCIPSSTPSSSENPQVDVDLGSLKSVSRLHAKIEYEEEEEKFMLHVMGRNGAWVDGVWSGSGSKVPLGDRSQIQIASRTFHFVLPPPPAPEDSPSPSSHASSGHRARSPSVDITSIDVTSISPPSSLPSCSPPPVPAAPAPPKNPPHVSAQPQLPNSNSIPRPKSNPKKRKKSEIEAQPLPKPDVIPPKPQYTYAQLCYRAIKGLAGRGSLQDICQWIQENFEYYKYSDKDWESSVRHNLSSNRAFNKAERGPDEKGKGALWTLDPQYEASFEEAERKQALAAMGGAAVKESKALSKKGKGPPLDPPFKRSIKGDNKGTPLPPPLTSVPLVPKSAVKTIPAASFPAPVIKTEPAPFDAIAQRSGPSTSTTEPSTHPATPESAGPSSVSPAPAAASAFPAIPASVRLPIVIGLVPNAGSSSSADTASTPPKPISLHENTLYLNPEIFSHLTPKHLQDLEVLGAQKALEILQSYIVRYYKEKLKAEGSRGRGRGRPKRGRGVAGISRGGAPGASREGSSSDLFTTAPLPTRTSQPPPQQAPPPQALVAPPPMASLQPAEDLDDPVIVVDDDSPDDSPPTKRQRTDPPVG
ncbi:Pre-rRNA-processing protein fhl1 [Steccherinum ochraceum]|uniref:Pre-rRNA-processing protein fhl1 n=1 Tax=Steccherinum ochraceum TaxID=92696 RepID=A0A4R0RYL5_9APHY|nr:Pre-rRNA-processing protein fhl1 [Steccherinum ochraceum]